MGDDEQEHTLVKFTEKNAGRLTALTLFFACIVLFIDAIFSGLSQIIMVVVSDFLFVFVGLTIIESEKDNKAWTVTIFRYVLLFFVVSFAWMSFNKTLENIHINIFIIRTNALSFFLGAVACLIYSSREWCEKIVKYVHDFFKYVHGFLIYVHGFLIEPIKKIIKNHYRLLLLLIIISFFLFYINPRFCEENKKCEPDYVEYPNSFYDALNDSKMSEEACKSGCYQYYKLTVFDFEPENNMCHCDINGCVQKNENWCDNLFKIDIE